MADINVFAVHPSDLHKVRNIRSDWAKGSFNEEIVQRRQGVNVDLLLLHQRARESCEISLNLGPIVFFDYCGLIIFPRDLAVFQLT